MDLPFSTSSSTLIKSGENEREGSAPYLYLVITFLDSMEFQSEVNRTARVKFGS